jgi:hypothetical protein
MSLIHRLAVVLHLALLTIAIAACGDDNAPRGGGGDDDDDDDGGGTMVDAGDTPDGGQPDAGVEPDAGGSPDGGDRDAGGSPDGGDRDGGGAPDAGDRDGGGAPDAGETDAGAPDAGPTDAGEPDAGEPDAGEPDAGPDELDGEFLLALVAIILPDSPIRFITTVDFTPTDGGAGTAVFTFQPIIVDSCAPGMGGLPVGDPVTTPPVDIAADGTFQIGFVDLVLPAQANPLTCEELTASSVDVDGTVQSPDLTCGTGLLIGTIEGTFGAIRIEPGTVGDANLPEPVTACP